MRTLIKKDGDTIIVSMEGFLDFENQISLRDNLLNLANQTRKNDSQKRIIFNLENLEFVGSSGISAFIQTLKEFNATATSIPRYCHVRSEFQKLIRAFDEEEIFEFFENEDHARDSFDQ